MIFIIKVFRTIVFIFIVISTTFRPICSPAFFRCLSNSGTFTELRTTSFIETTVVVEWFFRYKFEMQEFLLTNNHYMKTITQWTTNVKCKVPPLGFWTWIAEFIFYNSYSYAWTPLDWYGQYGDFAIWQINPCWLFNDKSCYFCRRFHILVEKFFINSVVINKLVDIIFHKLLEIIFINFIN